MKIERMEILGINVRDIDQAKALFSRVLGVEFLEYELGVDVAMEARGADEGDPHKLESGGTRIAIDRSGYIELIQTRPPVDQDGFRNIHFKVDDMAAAMHHMDGLGLRVAADLRVGGLREVIYDAGQLHGIRLCLVAYDAPTLVDAVLGGA